MKIVDTHDTFEQALTGSSSQVREIAERLRALIVEVYLDVIEVPWPKQKIAGTAWDLRRCQNTSAILVPLKRM